MELFQSITGTSLIHVPYKGSGPALVDLLAGQINMMFTNTTSGVTHVSLCNYYAPRVDQVVNTGSVSYKLLVNAAGERGYSI